MALSNEQVEQIKQQLIEQIESTFPEDKKAAAISQLEQMDEEELENFLIQNKWIKTEAEGGEEQCIFCSIAKGRAPSYKIAENENAVAVLEINPFSEGHSILIPKVHVQEISKETKKFAEEIADKIKNSLATKKVVTEQKTLFGHTVIDIVPIYEGKKEKEREKASQEELKKIQKKILSQEKGKEKSKEAEKEKPAEKEIISEKTPWLPKRKP